MTFDEMDRVVADRLSPKRYNHVLGCVKVITELAKRWGADESDARSCALLHDFCKEDPVEDQLRVLKMNHIEPDSVALAETELLHAWTGAVYAGKKFGMTEEICDAIRYHTTGKAAMTKLEKLMYLADIIEPGRKYEGVQEIRDLAYEDLDRALLLALDRSLLFLLRKRVLIHPDSFEARNYLLEHSER